MLTATILLAYAIARFVDLPSREFTLQLPGVFLAWQLNANTIVGVLVAGLTATGADWLLREHPSLEGKSTLEHWILPALTALVFGVSLKNLPTGVVWWVFFGVGGLLLILVLIAEYIAVDAQDLRHPAAAAGLTALSFALYLILTITLRASGARLLFLLPAVVPIAGLVFLRAAHLRLGGRWYFRQAAALALIIGQIAAALHYWPITPISYGLALFGPAYALTVYMGNLNDQKHPVQSIIEPAVILAAIWLLALWIR